MAVQPVGLSSEVTITSDALVTIGAARGVTTWPAVLDLMPVAGDRHVSPPDAADTTFSDTTLAVLCAPDAQIDICIHDDTVVRRACLARRGHDHVLAVRSGETIELCAPRIVDVDDIGAVVASVFPPVEVPPFTGISVPTQELRDRLDRCTCAGDYAASFTAVGVSRGDAAVLSTAFETCRVHAEMVATATVDGITTRSSGTVNVYDTAHGRIIAEPAISPDGRMWTTIAPGSTSRMGHAVGQLLETLPVPGWMP